MRKKRLIIIAGLVVAVIGVLGYILFPSPEPVYQGKTLTFWLDQYGSNYWSKNHEFGREAATAIRHLGTNLIPAYLKMLSTHPSRVKIGVLARTPPSWFKPLHLPTVNEYKAEVDSRCARGAYGLMALGPDSKPAVPALIAHLNSRYARVRYFAVFTIRYLGPVARDALPAIIKCLNDSDYDVRWNAIVALGDLHGDPEHVVPLLLDVLKKNGVNHPLSGLAIEALDKLDTAAAPAIPALCDALNDPDVTVRLVALRALGRIHAQPDVAVPALIANLSRERQAALNNFFFTLIALSQYGPNARPAVPAMLPYLRDPDPQVRQYVLMNLKKIDPDAAAKAEAK